MSKLILDFVGGVIHQIENVKFSKPFNKTFIKKILDGKTNQNEYDNIKMFYSIIEHKKNIENKIFNKTDTKKQIENIKIEIEKLYSVCEGIPILKKSFSNEEPKENENEEIEILDEEIKDEIENENSDDENENENEETEILDESENENLEENSDDENDLIYEESDNENIDFDLEIKKMKEQKRLYDLKIKKMKEKQKQILRHQKIEKMKAQQKPDEKEQLRELINNLNYQVDDEYKKDMINLLEKLKPIHKHKKEKIILNKERNIKALKVDVSKRYVCPFCFGFRMDEKKFFDHINICKKYDEQDEDKIAVLECIRDKEYKNFKCPTTEQSIQKYNKKYGDELGYIEKY